MVETAQAWGWSPTAMIRGAKNPHKHHPADYNFAHAVQVLKDEKCQHCGVPIWWAMSEDSAVAFKEDEHVCYSCKYTDEQKKERKEERPGERHTVRAVPEEGYDALPTRSDFFKRMQEKHEAALAREAEKLANAS